MVDYTCKNFHISCTETNLRKLIVAVKYTVKVYSIVHGAPLLLFKKKREELMKNPKEVLINYIKKVFSSMCFLGGFIMVMRTGLCLSRLRSKINILNILLMSALSCIGVLLEDPKRAEDYAVFTFPRLFEALWDLLKKLGLARDIPHANKIIFAISMALLLVCKVHFANEMPQGYKNQLDFFFGKENENKIVEIQDLRARENLDDKGNLINIQN